MRKYIVLFFFILPYLLYAKKINWSANSKGIYNINKVIDLKGDTLCLKNNGIILFDNGNITNGTIFSPYAGNIIIKGNVKQNNSKYYGSFYTIEGNKLTSVLDTIKRPFKSYQPFMLWTPVSDMITAYRMKGNEGVFLVYHLKNQFNGKTTDKVSIADCDKHLYKDNDDDIINSIIAPLKAERVNVVGLMFHCEGEWDDNAYGKRLSRNYQNYILHKVKLYKRYVPNLRIVYISNEQPWFIGENVEEKQRKAYTSSWEKCLFQLSRKLHNMKLEVGFKYQGTTNAIRSIKAMDKRLLKTVDIHSINYYPYSGTAQKTDLYNMEKINGEAAYLDKYMNLLRQYKPNINLTISETGILPYRASLPMPWQYKDHTGYDPEVVKIHLKTIRLILTLIRVNPTKKKSS